MSKEFYILCAVMVIIIIWNISLVNVDNYEGIMIRGLTSFDVKKKYAAYNSIDYDKVILYKYDGYRRLIANDVMLSGGRFAIGARPIVGDHIHAAMSIYIHGRAKIDAEHDRQYLQDIPYESPYFKESICKIPGDIAYTKLWPHSGVHTHCDGLIHIHPWSAPALIRKEGLDIRLKLWFDQVGILYREYPYVSLTFPDGKRYDGNETHQWRLAEKKCFKNIEPDNIYKIHLGDVWLGHAYASYVLWFDKITSNIPKDIPTHIEILKKTGAYGFDKQTYPNTCWQLNGI